MIFRFIMNVAKNISLVTLTFMTWFITLAVIGRTVGMPIIGDIELIEFSMILLVSFAFAYTESQDGHISIEILVDRLPPRIRLVLQLAGKILTCIVSAIMAWAVMVQLAEVKLTSELLRIPFLPFKYIILIGFILWCLEALMNVGKIFGKLKTESKDLGGSHS